MNAVVEAGEVVARGLNGEEATDHYDRRSAGDASLEDRLHHGVGQLYRLLGQPADLGDREQARLRRRRRNNTRIGQCTIWPTRSKQNPLKTTLQHTIDWSAYGLANTQQAKPVEDNVTTH